MSKYYLAGPMSGVPQQNFPLFNRVAAVLRAQGYDVISPAELDDDELIEAAMASDGGPYCKMSWGELLARDVKMVADDVQGLFLLPGWEKSRGAKLEAFVGVLCGHTFTEVDFYQGAMVLSQTTPAYIMSEIYNVTK